MLHLTSIRNVKFYKNALEYNVHHRCLCYFLKIGYLKGKTSKRHVLLEVHKSVIKIHGPMVGHSFQKYVRARGGPFLCCVYLFTYVTYGL